MTAEDQEQLRSELARQTADITMLVEERDKLRQLVTDLLKELAVQDIILHDALTAQNAMGKQLMAACESSHD